MKAILIDTNLFLNQKEVNINDLVREVEVDNADLKSYARYMDCEYIQPVCRLSPSLDWVFADEEGLLHRWPTVATMTPWYAGELVGSFMIGRNGKTSAKTTVEEIKAAILEEKLSFRILSSADRPIKPVIIM